LSHLINVTRAGEGYTQFKVAHSQSRKENAENGLWQNPGNRGTINSGVIPHPKFSRRTRTPQVYVCSLPLQRRSPPSLRHWFHPHRHRLSLNQVISNHLVVWPAQCRRVTAMMLHETAIITSRHKSAIIRPTLRCVALCLMRTINPRTYWVESPAGT